MHIPNRKAWVLRSLIWNSKTSKEIPIHGRAAKKQLGILFALDKRTLIIIDTLNYLKHT